MPKSNQGYWGLSNCLLEIWPGIRPLRRIQKKRSPIIQRVGQFLVGDPGVLDGIGRVGVAELALYCGDIAGFLYEVPAHGVAGVMGGVALDAGQVAHFVEHRVEE